MRASERDVLREIIKGTGLRVGEPSKQKVLDIYNSMLGAKRAVLDQSMMAMASTIQNKLINQQLENKKQPEIYIDPIRYKETWNNFARRVRDIISSEMTKLGYEQWLEDDYLSIEGYYNWWKHPNRVAKICLTIGAEFGDHPEYGEDGVEIYEYSITLSINNAVNTMTEMHETVIDYPEAYNSWLTVAHSRVTDNTFDFPDLDLSIPNKMEAFIEKFDKRAFLEFDGGMKGDVIEKIHGPFGNKNADFKDIEDYRMWLEWLGMNVTDFAISHEIDELLPQEAKDIFLF